MSNLGARHASGPLCCVSSSLITVVYIFLSLCPVPLTLWQSWSKRNHYNVVKKKEAYWLFNTLHVLLCVTLMQHLSDCSISGQTVSPDSPKNSGVLFYVSAVLLEPLNKSIQTYIKHMVSYSESLRVFFNLFNIGRNLQQHITLKPTTTRSEYTVM